MLQKENNSYPCKGHNISTCWERPEHTLKQPQGYKPKFYLNEVKKHTMGAETGKMEVQAVCVDANDKEGKTQNFCVLLLRYLRPCAQ